MLNQRLQLKLSQKLTPQQILLMKLIQLPSLALEQRVKQEIEDNPALDEVSTQEVENDDQSDLNQEESNTSDDEFSLEDYLPDDDELPAYKLNAKNNSTDDEKKDIPFSSGMSFHELLLSQLQMQDFDEREEIIAKHLIGDIDDSGYIERDLEVIVDDLAFMQNIETRKDELRKILRVIQTFDPAGVGARNLRECLLIQLDRKPQTESVKNAYQVISRSFSDFTKKHYEKILSRTGMTSDELKEAVDEILKLNPKPGNSLNETSGVNYSIIPDFIISNNDGELELIVNSWSVPELRVSNAYSNMIEHFHITKNKTKSDKEAMVFVKQKIDSAKWFIEAVKQRQNTLFITMTAIMNYQFEYFQTGDETNLKPMILKDIANIVKMDISTVSRVTNSKYVQTPFGTFLLKSFFSEAMENADGKEVSTLEIKKGLKNIIDAEDKSKPYSDDKLKNLLKEKGYNIARRTVAKYREQLSVPVARLRKEL